MQETKEVVVATMPGVESKPEEEKALSKQVSDIEFAAESIVITDDDAYAKAGEFGRMLKTKAAEVTTFFKPMKDSAFQAHKAVCEREKSMLQPLKNAETIVKKTMGAYLAEKERIRREAEEKARREAEAERERLLAEAQAKEQAGDEDGAESAMAEAVVMDDASRFSQMEVSTPRVSGVSKSKDWMIVEIDDKAVPLTMAGVEIRPVDRAAVMRLIRASKGTIEIPGIVYRETSKIAFSRR